MVVRQAHHRNGAPVALTGAVLNGDASLRTIQSQVRGAVTNTPASLNTNAVKTLADMGVSFQTDGTLKLDSTKFDKAVSSNFTAVATALGASMGATRVITDRAWVPHSRQIGTTGVVVAPELYLAFGISGAVQHTAGLGDPDHVISINTDPHCPMMAMADLAIVADANATLDELAVRLRDAPEPRADESDTANADA